MSPKQVECFSPSGPEGGLFELPAEKLTPDEHRRRLQSRLWAAADVLRGQMDASQYKIYMLTTIFYKELSEQVEREVRDFLQHEQEEFRSYDAAWADGDYREEISEHLLNGLGYIIEPGDLYSSLLREVQRGPAGDWSIDRLSSAFRNLSASTVGTGSQHDFEGLFETIDLNSPMLGRDAKAKSDLMGKVLVAIGGIDFHSAGTEIDLLGDAYEYLIGQFASNAGKKGGEFYTPQPVSTLVARLLAELAPKLETVYDPTCGSGSLLLRVAREAAKNDAENGKFIRLYGQELNTETYNLGRMNLILHGVNWQNFTLENGNTLTEDLFEGQVFDGIAANPPYSTNWDHGHKDTTLTDPRFAPYGALAPQSKADFAFVQHIVHHLSETGVAAVVLPHGVLFRGQAEGKIRQALLEKNLIDGIISLPQDMFYGTGIATVIMVLRKGRNADEKVRFIDASREFEKPGAGLKNLITDEHIAKILDAYVGEDESKSGKDIEKYSVAVPREIIMEHEYSLKVDLYVSSEPDAEPLPELNEVREKIRENGLTLNRLLSKIEESTLEFVEVD